MLHQHDHGWETVVLKGGPHAGHRFNIRHDEDSLTLYDGPTPHCYLRTNGGMTLYHEGIVCAAFGKAGRR